MNFFGKNGKLLNACWKEQRRVPVLIFYILLLGIFIGQMRYYAVNVRGFADEIQQISYVAYIAENHTAFPEFENMYQLHYSNDTSGVIEAQMSTLNNYLGHPPLYYWIMQLANAVTVSGDTYIINVDRLRILSELLAIIGIVLALYIGYSRIRGMLPQMLYGMVLISVPMLEYCCAGISNDTLAILAVSLFLLGIIRFFEKKINYGTFFLVAFGISVGLLTKLTVGAMLMFAVIFTVLVTLLKEHSLRSIFNRYFWVSCIVYVFPLIYFLHVYLQYKTLQPGLAVINYEQYLSSGFYNEGGEILSLKAYYDHFKLNMQVSWIGIASNGYRLIRQPNWKSPDVMGLYLIVWIPVVSLVIPDKEQKFITGAKLALCGVLCTLVYHFVNQYQGHQVSAYLGGCSARYYLCALPILAFLCAWVFGRVKRFVEKGGAIFVYGLSLLSVALTGLLFYENFIYFLINL